MGVVAAFTIAMVMINAFECPKPSDAWSVEILLQGSGPCRDLHPIYYSQAAFNILSDGIIIQGCKSINSIARTEHDLGSVIMHGT